MSKFKVLPEDEFYAEIKENDSDDDEFNFDEPELSEDSIDSDFDNPDNETAEERKEDVEIDKAPLEVKKKTSVYVDPAKKKSNRKSTRKLTVKKSVEYHKLALEKESKVRASSTPLLFLFSAPFLCYAHHMRGNNKTKEKDKAEEGEEESEGEAVHTGGAAQRGEAH